MNTSADAPGPDYSTQLSEKRTGLSVERSFLSFERTLMSWLRTSFSMISFGFTLVKFFQFLEDQQGRPVTGILQRTWTSDVIGLGMITIGTLALCLAVVQHWRRVKALRAMGLPSQWNLAMWVCTVVAALGVFAFLSLILGA